VAAREELLFHIAAITPQMIKKKKEPPDDNKNEVFYFFLPFSFLDLKNTILMRC
jgi:hypothetical protein